LLRFRVEALQVLRRESAGRNPAASRIKISRIDGAAVSDSSELDLLMPSCRENPNLVDQAIVSVYIVPVFLIIATEDR